MADQLGVWKFTAKQEELARDGHAEGQCGHCGSYRADGLPPQLHERGCPSYGVMDTPFGRVVLSDRLPDDVVLMAYSPPAPGTRPGDPDWVPLERRTAMVVDRPEPGAAQRRERSEPPNAVDLPYLPEGTEP